VHRRAAGRRGGRCGGARCRLEDIRRGADLWHGRAAVASRFMPRCTVMRRGHGEHILSQEDVDRAERSHTRYAASQLSGVRSGSSGPPPTSFFKHAPIRDSGGAGGYGSISYTGKARSPRSKFAQRWPSTTQRRQSFRRRPRREQPTLVICWVVACVSLATSTSKSSRDHGASSRTPMTRPPTPLGSSISRFSRRSPYAGANFRDMFVQGSG